MSDQSILPEERLGQLANHYANRVTDFRQRLAQVGPDKVLIILLDIGKNIHWMTAGTAAGQELVRPHRLPNTQAGLHDFLSQVDTLLHTHQPRWLILGHEPTGVYHEPWAHVFMQRFAAPLAGQGPFHMDYLFFNPYQVKLARMQTHLRHRKTDPRDLAAMFDLALRGLGQPAFLPTGIEARIRQEVGFIRAQARLLGLLEAQLQPQFDRLWPGAVMKLAAFKRAHPHMPLPTPLIQTHPWQRKLIRILLRYCPNPHELLARSDAQILALFRDHGRRAGPALLRTLRTWGAQAVLLPPDLAVTLADQLQRLFAHYCATETLVTEGRARLVPLLPHTPARHLVPIPGLSDFDAAAYLAILGSVTRFQRAAEVWAFVGFDPLADGSGEHPNRSGQISKHGDPAARDTLYQMGYRVALNYAPVSLTFLEAFDRGKCEVEATIHAAHRVNRLAFHLLSHDEPFVSQSSPVLEATAQRRWRVFKAQKRKRRGRRKRGKRRR